MAFGSGADLRIVSRAQLPNRFAEKGEIVAFRADGDTAEHVALLIGEPHGAAAAGARAQRMPDRRRARLAQVRLRAAARRRAGRDRRDRAGGSCSICGRRGGASAWSTSCAPMRCRTRASTRSTPICGSASRTTSATSRSRRGCWRPCRRPRIRLLTNNPRKVAALAAEGIEVAERRAAEGRRRTSITAPISRPSATAAATSSRRSSRRDLVEIVGDVVDAERAQPLGMAGQAVAAGDTGRSPSRPRRPRPRRRPANPR